MDSRIDKFIDVVVESSTIKGSRWDDIIFRFEWTSEAEVIKTYLSDKTALNEQQKKVMSDAFTKLTYKFDLKTIKRWVK